MELWDGGGLTLQAGIESNLFHYILVRVDVEGVCAIWVEEVMGHAVKGIRMENWSPLVASLWGQALCFYSYISGCCSARCFYNCASEGHTHKKIKTSTDRLCADVGEAAGALGDARQ